MQKTRSIYVIDSLKRTQAGIMLLERLHMLEDPHYDVELLVLRPGGELLKKLPPYVRRVKAPSGTYDIAAAASNGRAMEVVSDKIDADKKYAYLYTGKEKSDYYNFSETALLEFEAIYAPDFSEKAELLRCHPGLGGHTFIIPGDILKGRVRRLSARYLEMEDDGFEGVRIISRTGEDPRGEMALLMDTASELKERGFYFRWFMICEKREALFFNILARIKGLSDNVKISAPLKNPYPYIRIAHLYVDTGNGIAKNPLLEEALALDKIIIATASEGNRRLLDYEEDTVLADDDPMDIADAIEYTINELVYEEGDLDE